MLTILALAILALALCAPLAVACAWSPIMDPIHDRRLERRRALDAKVDRAVAPHRPPIRIAQLHAGSWVEIPVRWSYAEWSTA